MSYCFAPLLYTSIHMCKFLVTLTILIRLIEEYSLWLLRERTNGNKTYYKELDD